MKKCEDYQCEWKEPASSQFLAGPSLLPPTLVVAFRRILTERSERLSRILQYVTGRSVSQDQDPNATPISWCGICHRYFWRYSLRQCSMHGGYVCSDDSRQTASGVVICVERDPNVHLGRHRGGISS